MKFYYCNRNRDIVQSLKMLAMGSPGSSSLLLRQLGTLGGRIVNMLSWNIVVLTLARMANSRLCM